MPTLQGKRPWKNRSQRRRPRQTETTAESSLEFRRLKGGMKRRRRDTPAVAAARTPIGSTAKVHTSGSSSNMHEDITSAIEQQLERQRLQQRQPLAAKLNDEKEQAEEPENTEENGSFDGRTTGRNLGNYVYDPERRAYFPSSYFVKSQTESTPSDPHFEPYRTSSRGSGFSWLFSRQETLGRRQRWKLTAFGCSHNYLERIRLTESACAFRSKSRPRTMEWSMLFGSVPEDNVHFSFDDLTCKIHRPPWLRTFDVWTPEMETYPSTLEQGEPCSHMELQVATVMEEGCEIRSRLSERATKREVVPSSSKPQQLRYMRFSQSSDSMPNKPTLAVLSSQRNSSAVDFCFPVTDDEPGETHSHMQLRFGFVFPVNDVVEDGTSGFLVASPKRAPYHVSFDYGVSRPKIGNLVPSEILCMERAALQNQHYFGHRDGTVSLYDERSPLTASVLSKCSGPVTAMVPLDVPQEGKEGHVFLTRTQNLTTNAPCTLWDIRKPCAGMDFSLPVNAVSRLSNRCNGMAVDPHRTTLFSPYVEESQNDENPCLGVWSMITGEWVGRRRLASPLSNEIPVSNAAGVSWVELCQRKTSAWRWPKDKDKERPIQSMDSSEYEPLHESHAFGLWYKCGLSPSAHKHPGLLPPRYAGNIHQIVI